MDLCHVCVIAASMCLIVTGGASADDTVERCAYNGMRKSVPGPNEEPFDFCEQWQNRSCCTSDTVKSIKLYGQERLDGTKWDLCPGKPLSPGCTMMFKYETCFYECQPNLAPWIIRQRNSKMERFRGLPICSSSCDSWYEMCKHDYTCAKNWPRDMKWTRNGNRCKEGAQCQSYESVYGSGKALCENIWGSTFKYTPDSSKCLKLIFPSDSKPRAKTRS